MQVQPKSAIPLPAVIVTSSIACLIGLINIGSSTAFNDVVSLSVSCLYASYIIVEVFLLWRRLTGAVVSPKDVAKHTGEVNQLIWGPFHLPEIFGVLVNVFAIGFGIVIFVFSFFPVATPVVAKTMNFSVLMTGSVVLFAALYYVVSARKTYNGPLVEINPFSTAQSTRS